MKKLVTIFLLFLLMPLVFADGMMHVYDKDMWRLQQENQQVAVINFEKGYENMLISIAINETLQGEKAVWIFPVPAKPDTVAIDIMKGFPALWGTDINRNYREKVIGSAVFMAGYSTFPLGLFAVLFPQVYYSSHMFKGVSDSLSRETQNVIVHEVIEEMGLTTELVTAQDQASLTQYIQNKGLTLPENSQSMLTGYIGKEYSFVISYISDLQQFIQQYQTSNARRYNNQGVPIGVFVKFPTEKIFFPLKPTSIYGSQEIPVLLYVVNHISPVLYKEIQGQTEISYFTQQYFSVRPEFASFFNSRQNGQTLEYTKIKITAPSKYFVDDLWIENVPPATIGIKTAVSKYIWLYGLLLFISLSVAASIVSGIIIFKNTVSKKRLALHGLWNCLTLVVFIPSTYFFKTKELDPQITDALKKRGIEVVVKDSRKIWYLLLFYAFFIGFSVVVTVLMLALTY